MPPMANSVMSALKGNNSFVFFNTVKTYQFKAKDSQIKPDPLCVGNVSNSFTIRK